MTNKQTAAFVYGGIAAGLLLCLLGRPYCECDRYKSKEFLSSLIFGKSISIDVQSQNPWEVYIAYAFTPEGRDVSYL